MEGSYMFDKYQEMALQLTVRFIPCIKSHLGILPNDKIIFHIDPECVIPCNNKDMMLFGKNQFALYDNNSIAEEDIYIYYNNILNSVNQINLLFGLAVIHTLAHELRHSYQVRHYPNKVRLTCYNDEFENDAEDYANAFLLQYNDEIYPFIYHYIKSQNKDMVKGA